MRWLWKSLCCLAKATKHCNQRNRRKPTDSYWWRNVCVLCELPSRTTKTTYHSTRFNLGDNRRGTLTSILFFRRGRPFPIANTVQTDIAWTSNKRHESPVSRSTDQEKFFFCFCICPVVSTVSQHSRSKRVTRLLSSHNTQTGSECAARLLFTLHTGMKWCSTETWWSPFHRVGDTESGCLCV